MSVAAETRLGETVSICQLPRLELSAFEITPVTCSSCASASLLSFASESARCIKTQTEHVNLQCFPIAPLDQPIHITTQLSAMVVVKSLKALKMSERRRHRPRNPAQLAPSLFRLDQAKAIILNATQGAGIYLGSCNLNEAPVMDKLRVQLNASTKNSNAHS
jgi:hypothetical protein